MSNSHKCVSFIFQEGQDKLKGKVASFGIVFLPKMARFKQNGTFNSTYNQKDVVYHI